MYVGQINSYHSKTWYCCSTSHSKPPYQFWWKSAVRGRYNERRGLLANKSMHLNGNNLQWNISAAVNAIITKLEIIVGHAILRLSSRFGDDRPLGGAIIEVEVFWPFTRWRGNLQLHFTTDFGARTWSNFLTFASPPSCFGFSFRGLRFSVCLAAPGGTGAGEAWTPFITACSSSFHLLSLASFKMET